MSSQELEPAFQAMEPDGQAQFVWEKLFGHGTLKKSRAVKIVADYLQEDELAVYTKFEPRSPLGKTINGVVDSLLAEGSMDAPRDGYVRAKLTDAKDYTSDDWWMISWYALRDIEVENEDHAIHICADWARENCGLEFKRLSRGGVIWSGLEEVIGVYLAEE